MTERWNIHIARLINLKMIDLRPYQHKLLADTNEAWNGGATAVLCVSPTGSGKTRTMAARAASWEAPNVAIAHRSELVEQISIAFAAAGTYHRIIAPDATVKAISDRHRHHAPDAPCAVISVDTLIRRGWEGPLPTLWQMDEAHHVQPDNKWGRAAMLWPEARGCGWSASPCRLDKRPLRASFDAMVMGPTIKDLVAGGWLAPMKIYGLPQSVDLSGVSVAGGEFNGGQLHEATARSPIVGDVVEHYLRICPGVPGVTFAASVALAHRHAEAFNAAGVPAAVLHDRVPAARRRNIIAAFKAGEIMQVCNVDILGEGFDMPGIVCCSMARATMSYGLYLQQCGRPMRPGKMFGIILDHVGNVLRHGLPDHPPIWTLDGGTLRRQPNSNPVRVCAACFLAYSSFDPCCPYCGWKPAPSPGRADPETVEGDLTLYGAEQLETLRRLIDRRRGAPLLPGNLPYAAKRAAEKRWLARSGAMAALSQAVDAWAGRWQAATGDSLPALYRRFYLTFGTDPLTAQTLSEPEITALYDAIQRHEAL